MPATTDPAATGPDRAWPRWTYLGAGVVALLWLAMLPTTRFRMFPDGVSYLAIAEHLTAGRWSDAANAYWSPLFAWLLAPFVAAGADPFLAARLAGLVAALATAVALARTLATVGVDARVGGAVLVATSPVLVAAAAVATPDLLLVAVTLLAVDLLCRPAAATEPRPAVLAGLAVGLAYLTKLIALPVLTLVAVGVVAARWWQARRQGDPGVATTVARGGAVMLVGLAAVVLPWAVVLSVTTGSPTLGTAAGVNLQVAAADASGSPIYRDGLFAPATPHAANIWEDPAALPPSPPAEPSTSAPNADGGWAAGLAAEVERRWATVQRSLGELERLRRWRLAAPIALLLHVPVLVAWRRGRVPERAAWTLVGLVATAGLTVAATFAVHLEERYLWVAMVGLLPGAALGVQHLGGRTRPVPWRDAPGVAWWRPPLAGLLLVALLVGLAVPAARGLRYDAHRDHHLAELARLISAEDDLTGREVASDTAWPETLVLCLHLGCRYHGLVRPDRHDDFSEQLAAHRIERFLWWGEDAPQVRDGSATPDGGSVVAGEEYVVWRRGGPWDGRPRRLVIEPHPTR